MFTFTVGPGDRETRDGVLNAFDSANGSRLWEFRTANVYSGPLPPLVVGDAVLVVGDPDETTYDNAVYVVDAASGSLRTQFGIHVDVGTAAPVVLDDNSVGQGYLSAYTGTTQCSTSGGGGGTVHTLMIAANGPTDYVLTVDGTLDPDTVGGDFRAEGSDDTPERNADGTLTASGGTGPAENPGGANFHGDRFLLTGSVDRLDLSKADSSYEVNVYLDERLVSPADVLQLSG
ncbi:PQQ-binding-like beta-propeller repeat protein [Salinirubellus salinus]|uniref:PQQ-binding-like beta-propeller repeat protein n=1 Tax=Salinirubellus salinus TaxID=1364945 RepID=A0A9E7R0C4_9EURY|nr:PQQ-binding-like beta-propeller repeat protein [Salinirubellus salinus]UWM53345.1 PQQ-binding-like beta-propeller repeat protein [Salinirubellus salinus]